MRKTALVAGLLVLLCITPAFGQWERKLATASVPFGFSVGSTALPAGNYDVFSIANTQTMRLRNVNSNESALFTENDILLGVGQVAADTKFVFRSDPKGRVLHQVVLAGDDHIHDVVHSTRITELAR